MRASLSNRERSRNKGAYLCFACDISCLVDCLADGDAGVRQTERAGARVRGTVDCVADGLDSAIASRTGEGLAVVGERSKGRGDVQRAQLHSLQGTVILDLNISLHAHKPWEI